MKRILCVGVILVAACAQGLFAMGSSEAAGGSGARTQYLAERGVIAKPGEIHTDAFIAAINYRYALPKGDIGVYLYNGNRQLSINGQEDILQVGVQAAETAFEDLAPLNLAFVIDHSGSMASADKLQWVKDAFDIFINKVRDRDYVSLVIFDTTAEVVFPATKMDTSERRKRFQQAVHAIQAGGSTNIRAGLQLGCLEVLKNLNAEYTNRVMFLSDGQDTVGNTHEAILNVARQFADQGVTISTIGLGQSFDLELMNDMAKVGEGSSRFIADREQMEKTFGTELDRMVVARARNLKMTLEFLVDVDVMGTWGYENRRSGNTIHYFLPTLHDGDYETILVRYRTKPQHSAGNFDLARFSITYEDVAGKRHQTEPRVIKAAFVAQDDPVAGISDGMVLRSGTMLDLAENLKRVGELYYSGKSEQNLQEAMNLAVSTKKELVNAKTRLDNDGFDKEIDIVNRYIGILGGELKFAKAKTAAFLADIEIAPPTPARNLNQQADNLCREIVLDLQSRPAGVVAVCDFASRGGQSSTLVSQLSTLAYQEIVKVRNITVVRRSVLDAAIVRAGLTARDLTDKINALKLGRSAGADYILTGTVMTMKDSVIVFSRLLNVGTGEVESAAQIIVPRP